MAINSEDLDDLKAVITRIWFSDNDQKIIDDMVQIIMAIVDTGAQSSYRLEDVEDAVKYIKKLGE